MDLEYIQQVIWFDLLKQGPIREPCQHCNGLGVMTINVPLDHPAFGHAFVCICRREGYLKALVDRMLAEAGGTLPEDSIRFGLVDFPALAGDAAALIDGQPIDENGQEKVGFLLAGPTGVGKSTLASIILREKISRGESALWIAYMPFIKRMQATYDPEYTGPSADQIMRLPQRASFLVIDDLGRPKLPGQESDDRIEIVFRLLDYRSAKRLPTVITTNLNTARVRVQFDDRIASRIGGLCKNVAMVGVDYRTGERVRV